MRSWIPIVLLAWLGWAVGAWAGEVVRSDDGAAQIQLKVHNWVLPDPTRSDTLSRSNYAVVQAFVREFPKIFEARYRARYEADPETYGPGPWDAVSVVPKRFSGITVEGVESDLLAIAGNAAPDVLYLNFKRSDTFIQQGLLYPLDRPEDQYLTSLTDEELAFRVHPKIWPVVRRDGPAGEEHVWAMPFGGVLGRVLLYRKDRFEEAGLAYPDASWTWDDLMHACKKLTDPAKGRYGIRMKRGKEESWYWTTFLYSVGEDVLAYDDEASRWKVVFNTPQAARAVDFYARLCAEPWVDANGIPRKGYAYRDAGDAAVKWKRGEIAMAQGYIDEKTFAEGINPDLVGIAPVPMGPEGVRGAELNSRMMGLFAGIEDPVVRDAAWEFIRFFDTREAMALKTRIMVESGYGAFVNPRYLRMFGYDDLIRLAPKGWEETFEITVASGRPEPYGRHCSMVYSILSEPLQKAADLVGEGELPADAEARNAVLLGLLDDAAARARRDMLKEIPEEKMTRYRGVAWVFLLGTVSVFVVLLRWVSKAFTAAGAAQGTGKGGRRMAWLLLIPALATILVWQYVPLMRGSVMAFQDYRLLGDSEFVGVDNFARVLFDPSWWEAVWHAIRYTFLTMVIGFLPPVILAVLLQEVPVGKWAFRAVYYLPSVLSGLVVVLLWKLFYEPSETGVLNALVLHTPAWAWLAVAALVVAVPGAFARRLWFHESYGSATVLGLVSIGTAWRMVQLAWPMIAAENGGLFATPASPIAWLDNADTAMLACVIPMVWAGLGPACLIYLAALKGVSDDFYEAADIDGATFVDKILFVVFPILRPLLLINFLGVFINAFFHAEATVLAMTGGGASTEVAGLHIFYKAYVFLQFGPATAMAWILGLMLIAFTVYQLRILSRLEFRATGGAG